MRENHTGQHDDTALQADGGVAFEKGHANAAGGLSRKTGQRDGRNGRRHVELEKAAVYRQDHHQGQHPNEQATQQGNGPQGDGVQEPHAFYGGHHLYGQGRGSHGSQAGSVHDGGDRPLGDVEQGHHEIQPPGNRRLSQYKPDEGLEGQFRFLQFGKAAAGFHDANDKEQDQQGVADGLEGVVDIQDDIPNPAALEVFRAGTDESP